jgi:hypothetical protein
MQHMASSASSARNCQPHMHCLLPPWHGPRLRCRYGMLCAMLATGIWLILAT